MRISTRIVRPGPVLILAALALLVFPSLGAAAPIRVGSWYISEPVQTEQTGTTQQAATQSPAPKNVVDQNLIETAPRVAAMARVIAYFDIVTLQGYINRELVKKLRLQLNQITGERWVAIARTPQDDPQGYAYLWIADRIHFTGKTFAYSDPRDVFPHNPFAVVFKDRIDHAQFVLATLSLADVTNKTRLTAILSLPAYWAYLSERFDSAAVILSGPMFFAPTHYSFDQLTGYAYSAVDATSIVPTNATFGSNSLFRLNPHADSIWLDRRFSSTTPPSGALPYADILGLPLKMARQRISKHRPVFTIFDYVDAQN